MGARQWMDWLGTWPVYRQLTGPDRLGRASAAGATIIHVDPRFTRTSALADLHVPIRAGSDIAFLGGIIDHVLTEEKYFLDYVRAYPNAATVVGEDFRDTEDLDGLFSGFEPGTRHYDFETGAAPLAGSAGTRLGIFEAGVQSSQTPKYTVLS